MLVTLQGNHLIVGGGAGNMQRLATDGEALGPPFALDGGWADTEGLSVSAQGELVTVEDDPERLSWFAPDGALLRRIDTMDLSAPLTEAQGIAIDPRTC